MKSECVLYQSTMVNNQPYQQLSNLKLDGISTVADAQNTDNGKLYGSFTYANPTYTLNLYSDVTKLNLVASATATALGIANIVGQNDSELSGTVNFAQYSANDTMIEAICVLATDGDLPFNYLTSVSDYDPTFGFAAFHIEAFDKIKEIVTSRYRSILANPNLIDTRQINGGLGGFDLSRIQSWKPLHEAAYHYAFALIAERQGFDTEGVFYKRAQQSKNIFKGYMESVELPFDTTQQRVVSQERTGQTFKISRA
jgi:hypothetical protein